MGEKGSIKPRVISHYLGRRVQSDSHKSVGIEVRTFPPEKGAWMKQKKD